MSDEKKDEMIKEDAENGRKFVWRWKDALIYGVIWIAAAAVIQLGVMGSLYLYRQVQSFHRMIDGGEWIDRFNQDDWKEEVKPDNHRRGSIKGWIRDHLPKDAAPDETRAVSETFFSVAGMLRNGELEGWNDSCAETIAQLQPNVSRKVWLPFMNGLVKQVGEDAKKNPESLAVFYEEAAKAVSAPVRSGEDENEDWEI